MNRAAEWLGLAAAPTFAIMAFLSATTTGPTEMLCLADAGGPLKGMTAMYLLMTTFHASPWLRRVGRVVSMIKDEVAECRRRLIP